MKKLYLSTILFPALTVFSFIGCEQSNELIQRIDQAPSEQRTDVSCTRTANIHPVPTYIQFLEKTTSVLAADRSVPGEKPRNLYVPFQSGFRTAQPTPRIRKDSTIKRIYTAYGHRWCKQA